MSRHRNIEEEFRAIAPGGRRGIPAAQPIVVGVTGSGGADSAASMSQASQEIAQLEAQFRQQASVLQANTQALMNNTSAHTGQAGGGGLGGALGSVAGHVGGGLGILSPIFSGLLSLFGGGSKPEPTPVTYYMPPPNVQISDTFRTGSPAVAPQASGTSGAAGGGAGSTGTHITVNVNAMDSQSFMDRSSDIASAVREAMLNLHPINDVVANL